jgi:outer membrane lipoprotein-sorting protein
MATLTLHRTVQLLLALSLFLATAGGAQRAVDLIDQLQVRLAHRQDYRYDLTCYERKGNQQEERSFRFFVKGRGWCESGFCKAGARRRRR